MILSAQPLANIKFSTKIPSDEQVKAYVDEAIQNVDGLIDMPQTFVSAITLNEGSKYTPVNGNINLNIEFKPSCDFNVNVQNAILCCLKNIAYIDDNGYNSYANVKSAMNRAKDIYTVTYDFNEYVSASTDVLYVQEGDSYDLSIAPITGKLKNFYYTMGGKSKFVLADGLTYDTLNFSIQHVLDNLVIHATAEDYGSKFPNMETLPLMTFPELNLNEDTTLIIDENENILGNMLYKDLIDNIIS